MNLTKTIRKTPVDLNLETAGTTYVEPGLKQQPKYDDEDKWVSAAQAWGLISALLPFLRQCFLYLRRCS
jgi:hypothetical protein